jgi:two-component system phosphate regulon response regulator PhoB
VTSKHVLLVEDDPLVAEMYKLRLEIDGLSVTLAGDGASALRLARELVPDAILLDIRIPRMDGLTVLELLRQGGDGVGRVPVLMLTNFSDPETVERAHSLGADGHLVKANTTPAQLSQRVLALIGDRDGAGPGPR